MLRCEFHYELPPELIAQSPASERSASRLLVLDGETGAFADRMFTDLRELLVPGDLVVLNDTRVLPARLDARKRSGGRVEVLLERVLDPRRALVQLRASHSPRAGTELVLAGGAHAQVEGREGRLFVIELDSDVEPYFERHGRVPLPPYIERIPDADDRERYQTVFARYTGAVAAPTAGLHFDRPLLDQLTARGVEMAYLTLHVGLGTFAPMRCDHIEDHVLHVERTRVGPQLCEQVRAARARGGRIVAVGTTVVRALETAAAGTGRIEPFEGATDLYIRPGFEFRVVDAIVTNFHLPESSLLVLVAAYAGIDNVMRAYRHAIAARYRFFSYGDAMFLLPNPTVRVRDAL
jgi:S-adenosylmethionine:tRNA ribosyltransferase-isomerase